MPGKESNPIQQRMELLLERWEAAVVKPGINLVRIHAEDNEKDMVGAFYTYLLGVDTGNHDVPVIFESIFHNDEQYTTALLKELEGLLDIWNNANKDDLNITLEPVNWKPDYSLINKDNPAYLFIENMNRLTAYLQPQPGTHLVAILKVSFTNEGSFSRWLQFALKNEFSVQFKILIDDVVSHPFYGKLADLIPDKIFTIHPQLDMDNAMQQIAAMGSPDEPAVQYRQAFVQLMQAIEKRKEAEVPADKCLEIAVSNLEKNAYWIGQVIAVYAALANDQVGYKNYKKAIAYATDGVEAAEQSMHLVRDEFVYKKFLAQAVMLRGSLYAVDKDWQKAVTDFTLAAGHYTYTNDIILAMEAYRMTGYGNHKYGDISAACKALAAAVEASRQIPPHIIKFTTFAGVIELLLEINNQQYINREAVEAAAEAVYGKDWIQEVMNWKSPHYEQVTDPSKTIVI